MAFQLKRLWDEFLLGALADRGFLPGHGFHTCRTICYNSPAWRMATADRSISGENRFAERLRPQRQLDLAIRDYAPARSRSGCLVTSLQRDANLETSRKRRGVKEVTGLLDQWTCSVCGQRTLNEAIPGFARLCQQHPRCPDFATWSLRSTSARCLMRGDEVELSRPRSPISTATNHGIRCLIRAFGRYSHLARGSVFMLPCVTGELCPVPRMRAGRSRKCRAILNFRGFNRPRPLRRLRDLPNNMSGNRKPFTIQRRLALGHELETDVFEASTIYLLSSPPPMPSSLPAERSHRSSAIESIRNGYAVGRAVMLLASGILTISSMIAPLGGGFSVLAEPRIRSVMDERRKFSMQTPVANEPVQPATNFRLPDAPDSLDRSSALQFVKSHLKLHDTYCLRIFVPGAIIAEFL